LDEKISLIDQFTAKSLVNKFNKAIKGTQDAKIAFDELDASISPRLAKQWKVDEARAMDERGEALRIYDVQQNNSKSSPCIFLFRLQPELFSSSNSK
jgi:hypothetical protein